MKLIIEILLKDERGDFILDKSKTVFISNVNNSITLQKALDAMNKLKPTLKTNQKIRVLEYHNDDKDDKNRKPCIILYD